MRRSRRDEPPSPVPAPEWRSASARVVHVSVARSETIMTERSAGVGRSREAGWIHGDVDGAACRNNRVAGAGFGTDEELAALPPVEPGANLQGLVDRYGCEIPHRQLAGEGRFLQHADHESGHVVERGGHDATVGTARCS